MRIGPDGSPLDSELFRVVETNDSESGPVLSSHGSWTRLAFDWGRYVRWQGFVGIVETVMIGSDGRSAGTPSPATLRAGYPPYSMAMAMAPDGTALLVYGKSDNIFARDVPFQAKRFTPNGAALDADPVYISEIGRYPFDSAALWLGSDYIVVWSSGSVQPRTKSDIDGLLIGTAGPPLARFPIIRSKHADLLGDIETMGDQLVVGYARSAPDLGGGSVQRAFVRFIDPRTLQTGPARTTRRR